MTERPLVIFACVHNAGRSQMAAALLRRHGDPARVRVSSAGTSPGTQVHPEVRAALAELGIDVGDVAPQRLTDELAAQAQLLITMGCGEACPVVHGVERLDWPLEDPKGKPLAVVRAIRDDVDARVRALVAARGWGRGGTP
jgi:arsenate reductase